MRMLKSIDNHIAASGLTPEEIRSAKKQRDLAAMIDGLGYDRLLYIVAQKIGSHYIHGTWPALLFHYLESATTPESSHSARAQSYATPTLTSSCSCR